MQTLKNVNSEMIETEPDQTFCFRLNMQRRTYEEIMLLFLNADNKRY